MVHVVTGVVEAVEMRAEEREEELKEQLDALRKENEELKKKLTDNGDA